MRFKRFLCYQRESEKPILVFGKNIQRVRINYSLLVTNSSELIKSLNKKSENLLESKDEKSNHLYIYKGALSFRKENATLPSLC